MSLSVGANLAQTFATATTTSERSDTYGIFGYSGATIGILIAVTAGLIAATFVICIVAAPKDPRYHSSHMPAPWVTALGILATIAVVVLTTLLLLTWWTATDWNSGDQSGVGVGSVFICIALVVGTAVAYHTLLIPSERPSEYSGL